MRWTKKQYSMGDRREVRRFLLLPKTITGETRWLEWARWSQVLVVRYGEGTRWDDAFWLDDPKKETK